MAKRLFQIKALTIIIRVGFTHTNMKFETFQIL